MKRSTITIVALCVALVGSNLYWAYGFVDAGITASYRQENLHRHREALREAIAVIPVAARVTAEPEEILQAARNAADEPGFEKDGFVWVGQLGYRFGEGGRLVEVQTNWSPF